MQALGHVRDPFMKDIEGENAKKTKLRVNSINSLAFLQDLTHPAAVVTLLPLCGRLVTS